MTFQLFTSAAVFLFFALIVDRQATKLRLVAGVTFEVHQFTVLAAVMYLLGAGTLIAAIQEALQ